MNFRRYVIIFTVTLLISYSINAQNPPNLHWVSDDKNNRDLTISPDGTMLLTSVLTPKNGLGVILISRKRSGRWSPLEIASFSGEYSDIEPMFSPDGKRVWFSSKRPIEGSKEKDWDIWSVEVNLINGNFSAATNAGSPVNSKSNEYYPSVTSSGVLYFTSDRPGGLGKEDIYKFIPGAADGTQIVNLGKGVNTADYEFNAFVAPDESYLIYTATGRADSFGGGDLYISYTDNAGVYQSSLHFGDKINSQQLDYCPFVKDEKLYFTSEVVRQKKRYTSYGEFEAFLENPGNGLGDVYQADFKSLLSSSE